MVSDEDNWLQGVLCLHCRNLGLRKGGDYTHRQDKIMFNFLQVAQREDKALWVPLTLPDQEQAARREGNIRRGHTAATFTQGLSYPRACCLALPAPYPSTRPCCAMSLWLSSREMRPWNHGWVRWMAEVRETDGASLRGGDPHTNHPHQKCSEKPRSPTPGDAGPRPPALRLVPEHGVGRLRRWFVFFCRAEGDTVGVGGFRA